MAQYLDQDEMYTLFLVQKSTYISITVAVVIGDSCQ